MKTFTLTGQRKTATLNCRKRLTKMQPSKKYYGKKKVEQIIMVTPSRSTPPASPDAPWYGTHKASQFFFFLKEESKELMVAWPWRWHKENWLYLDGVRSKPRSAGKDLLAKISLGKYALKGEIGLICSAEVAQWQRQPGASKTEITWRLCVATLQIFFF